MRVVTKKSDYIGCSKFPWDPVCCHKPRIPIAPLIFSFYPNLCFATSCLFLHLFLILRRSICQNEGISERISKVTESSYENCFRPFPKVATRLSRKLNIKSNLCKATPFCYSKIILFFVALYLECNIDYVWFGDSFIDRKKVHITFLTEPL